MGESIKSMVRDMDWSGVYRASVSGEFVSPSKLAGQVDQEQMDLVQLLFDLAGSDNRSPDFARSIQGKATGIKYIEQHDTSDGSVYAYEARRFRLVGSEGKRYWVFVRGYSEGYRLDVVDEGEGDIHFFASLITDYTLFNSVPVAQGPTAFLVNKDTTGLLARSEIPEEYAGKRGLCFTRETLEQFYNESIEAMINTWAPAQVKSWQEEGRKHVSSWHLSEEGGYDFIQLSDDEEVKERQLFIVAVELVMRTEYIDITFDSEDKTKFILGKNHWEAAMREGGPPLGVAQITVGLRHMGFGAVKQNKWVSCSVKFNLPVPPKVWEMMATYKDPSWRLMEALEQKYVSRTNLAYAKGRPDWSDVGKMLAVLAKGTRGVSENYEIAGLLESSTFVRPAIRRNQHKEVIEAVVGMLGFDNPYSSVKPSKLVEEAAPDIERSKLLFGVNMLDGHREKIWLISPGWWQAIAKFDAAGSKFVIWDAVMYAGGKSVAILIERRVSGSSDTPVGADGAHNNDSGVVVKRSDYAPVFVDYWWDHIGCR